MTVVPPLGAGPVRVTVPTLEPPPCTDDGDTASPETDGASTDSVADRVTPAELA